MASNSRRSLPDVDKNCDIKIIHGIGKVANSRKTLLPVPINKHAKNSEQQSNKVVKKPGKENRNKEVTEKEAVEIKTAKNEIKINKNNKVESNRSKLIGGPKISVKEVVKSDDFHHKCITEAKAPSKKSQLLIAVAEESKGSFLSIDKGRKHSNLLSPFALPENVICIDDHDHSTQCYNFDYITYLRKLEIKQQIKPVPLAFKVSQDKRQSNARTQLADWLLEVCHYFKTGQECLYQTINLLDKILADSSRIRFSSKDMQLVGISCLLIATKIEEYYPANLKELARLTEDSWKPKEIVEMELRILQGVSFKPISVDPMPFLHRCISAARKSLYLRSSSSPIEEEIFYELCIFNVDSLTINYSYWELLPSLKAAAAVYAALILFIHAFQEICPFTDNDNVFYYDSSENNACQSS